MIAQKGWALLRYLHLRAFIEAKSAEISNVLVVGTGKGLAELAVAAEFTNLDFVLTDIVSEGRPRRPNYFHCMELSEKWAVDNLGFGVWDVLKPRRSKYDCIVSTEVLEHISEHELAVNNMVSHSLKYVYILAPYASKARNQDPALRARALNAHEHVVCGFDEEYFRSFPHVIESMYGVYWTGESSYRAVLNSVLANGETPCREALLSAAQNDLREEPPIDGKCLGIKCVIKV
jgi:hypothetical protein